MSIVICPTCNQLVVDNQCLPECPDNPLKVLGNAIADLEAVQAEHGVDIDQ